MRGGHGDGYRSFHKGGRTMKPCPFCAANDWREIRDGYYFECHNCGSEVGCDDIDKRPIEDELRDRAEKAEAELRDYKPWFPGKPHESELSLTRATVGLFKRYADSANRQWERAKPHLSADLLDQIQQLEELRNEPLAELRRRITNQRRELKKLNKKLMERGQ